MITLISRLIDRGNAYAAADGSGDVYFSRFVAGIRPTDEANRPTKSNRMRPISTRKERPS